MTSGYPFVSGKSAIVFHSGGKSEDPAPWRLQREELSTHCVVSVDVTPAAVPHGRTTLQVQAFDPGGKAIDSVTLFRASTAAVGVGATTSSAPGTTSISGPSAIAAKTGWSIPWIVAGSAAVATAGAAGTLAVRTHQGSEARK